jgi:HSP20 family protein
MKLVYYRQPAYAWPTHNRQSTLQDQLNQLFEAQTTSALPALDVQENKDNFTVRVELPGLRREDIEVSLEDGTLTISGERKAETPAEGTEVLRQERFFGKFSRALNLPAPVAADKVKAQYKDGILTVTLAKVEEAKPKQILVSE